LYSHVNRSQYVAHLAPFCAYLSKVYKPEYNTWPISGNALRHRKLRITAERKPLLTQAHDNNVIKFTTDNFMTEVEHDKALHCKMVEGGTTSAY
jgi:hypothetical protein